MDTGYECRGILNPQMNRNMDSNTYSLIKKEFTDHFITRLDSLLIEPLVFLTNMCSCLKVRVRHSSGGPI